MMIDEAKLIKVIEAAGDGLITVPELLGFTTERAERLYAAALAFFRRGMAARAERVLGWLVGAKPYVAKYWTAYAATLQAREAFVEAIRCNTIALAIDPHDVIARAHRGECCLLVGLIARALEDLREVARSNAGGELAPWVLQARRLLSLHDEAAALAG